MRIHSITRLADIVPGQALALGAPPSSRTVPTSRARRSRLQRKDREEIGVVERDVQLAVHHRRRGLRRRRRRRGARRCRRESRSTTSRGRANARRRSRRCNAASQASIASVRPLAVERRSRSPRSSNPTSSVSRSTATPAARNRSISSRSCSSCGKMNAYGYGLMPGAHVAEHARARPARPAHPQIRRRDFTAARRRPRRQVRFDGRTRACAPGRRRARDVVPGSAVLSTILTAHAEPRQPQRQDQAGRTGAGDQHLGRFC